MTPCELLKNRLVAEGLAAIEPDPRVQEHLASCPACQKLLAAYARIPGLLQELPDHDAPADLVEQLADPAGHPRVKHAPAEFAAPRLASGLAAAVVVISVIGLSWQLADREFPAALKRPAGIDEVFEHRDAELKQGTAPLMSAERPVVGGEAGQFADRVEAQSELRNEIDENRPLREQQLRQVKNSRDPVAGRTTIAQPAPAAAPDSAAREKSELEKARVTPASDDEDGLASAPQSAAGKPADGFELDAARRSPEPEPGAASRPNTPDYFRAQTGNAPVEEQIDKPDELARVIGKVSRGPGDAGDKKTAALADTTERSRTDNTPHGARDYRHGGGHGGSFLDDYQRTEGLVFQPANGYWANRHVPGDPQIRLLAARLARWDRSGLTGNALLEREVKPVLQPFDAPDNNALALSLMSDANAVEGPTRMRLQVGIQGIEHRHGQRPAMNLGVVINLAGHADDADRIAARALVDALLHSKQPGDRFALAITGQAESTVIVPADFRFGALQVARQAISGLNVPGPGNGMDLYTALQKMAGIVSANDDPSRPLGSSALLLIGAADLRAFPQLPGFAHEQAGKGITTSVVPLGNDNDAGLVEELVLSGLGSRRVLLSPAEAGQLIESELHAASRAVARAARLSIRLAPGVKLIGVVGSQRLDAERAERVRRIEQSMDQRLSKNLGIQADRGSDEEGVQIVIPSIFAGDSLVVLLDVLADQPGEVAEVSLRYKDLVFLRNGTLSSGLSLGAGPLKRGPAQWMVMKNLLAWEFSEALQRAATALATNDIGGARTALLAMRERLAGAQSSVNTWSEDQELQRDRQVLDHYLQILDSPEASQQLNFLTDSLRLAAWAKSHGSATELK